MLWIIVLGLLAILCVLQYRKSEKNNAFAKHLPLLKPAYPLVGNGLLFIGKSEDEQFKGLHSLTSADHKLTRFYFGTQIVIGTMDPETAHRLLSDPVWMDKPYFHEFFEIPYGLDTAKYDIWKVHRKAINPSFNKKALHSFIPIFKQYSQQLVDQLSIYPEGTTINIVEDVTKCSLDIVVQTVFGRDCETTDGSDSIGQKIVRFFCLFSKRLMNATHYVDFIYRHSADGRENRVIRKDLNQWAELMVKKVARRLNESSKEAACEEENFDKPKIFIDDLYSNKIWKFNQQEITDEAFTLVGAAMDTSSNTVAFCLLLMAMHPEVQRKVYDEAMQLFPSEDTPFTPDSLKQLKYLEMVLRETLRLFPAIPFVLRQSTTDSTVEDVNIPGGNLIAVDIFNMHRRKDLYGADADVFNPDHFSPEQSKNRNPLAFMAFSIGSRDCIGQTHNSSFHLFRMNDYASDSIQTFAESGHAHALEEELSRQSPAIHDEFHLPKIPRGQGSAEATFFVDGQHTKVSFITKIIPSPDWFIGMDSYNLCSGGRWLDNVTIDLGPLDAGTSNGLTFTSPKWPTNPPNVIEKITARYPKHFASSFFYPEIKHLPTIARVTFTKLHEYYGSNNVHKKVKKLKTKQRTRLLKKLAHAANGPKSSNRKWENETEKLANDDCRVGSWSPWSPCSKSCGLGKRTRTRIVIRYARDQGKECPHLMETQWCGSARECTVSDNYFRW